MRELGDYPRLRVCSHDKNKMAESKIAKLGTETVRRDISPISLY